MTASGAPPSSTGFKDAKLGLTPHGALAGPTTDKVPESVVPVKTTEKPSGLIDHDLDAVGGEAGFRELDRGAVQILVQGARDHDKTVIRKVKLG